MASNVAQTLFNKYASAMAYLVVEDSNVVESRRIKKIKLSEPISVTTATEFRGEVTDEYDATIKEKLDFTPLWKSF